MTQVHQGILNKLHGKLHTDEHFNKELQHIMKKISEGYSIRFYRDKFGRLTVNRGGAWWVVSELAHYDEFYKA